MAIEYRVIDLQTEEHVSDPQVVEAPSPEKAAEIALGVALVRSGSQRDLRARVYCERPGQPISMVRLYTKVADRRNA